MRLKTKKLIFAGLAGAAFTIAIGSIIIYFAYNHIKQNEIKMIRDYEEELTDLRQTARLNETAYTLVRDVEKGEKITEDLLKPAGVSSAAKAEDAVELPQLKRNGEYILYAKTDLKANTVLVNSMVYKEENITDDVREGEYSFIEIPSNVEKDEYIDVRIQFPSGDDFIVLPKKKVKDLLGITLWMNVNEREILTLSSAVVDAYLNEARIYAIPYEDPHLQSEAIMTYPVKENVKRLIQESPNVVDLAMMKLEYQNRARLESNLNMLNEDEKARIRTGTENTINNLHEVNEQIRKERLIQEERRLEEERLNEINKELQAQQSLIGGAE